MRVWMALDPDDEQTGHPRVSLQDELFVPARDMPPSAVLRGEVWEVRETKLDEETWANLVQGKISPDDQDALHRKLWSQKGDSPWPM